MEFWKEVSTGSVNCQFQIFNGTTNYQMSKRGVYPIQANTFVCTKSSTKKSTYHWRKAIPMAKFVNQYKVVI